MISKGIKQLVFILLLIVIVYVGILLFPSIINVFLFIFNVILPFIIAFVIAFVLQPLVLFIQKYVKKRWIAVLIVLMIFVILIFLLAYFVVPNLINDIKLFVLRLPEISLEIEEIFNKIFRGFTFLPDDYQPTFDNITNFVNNNLNKLNMASDVFFSKIFSYLAFLFVIPIILVYFLLDYEKILCYFRDLLIKSNKIRLKNYLGDLHKTMSDYFRGVLLVMLILVIVFSVAFGIIGLEYGLVFAIIIAITNIIPYIGSYIGTILPLLYALLDSPRKAIIVLIVCVIIQTVEADLLTPWIQGKRMKLHPLVVMLALLGFGALFGMFGMMLAVPLAAIIKITFQHYPINIVWKKFGNKV